MAFNEDESGDNPIPGKSRPLDNARIPRFGARKIAENLQAENTELRAENSQLRALLSKYGLDDVVEQQRAKEESLNSLKTARDELAKMRAEVRNAEAEKAQLKNEVIDMRSTVSLQDFGLFSYEHPAEDSVSLSTELESVRTQLKAAVRDGTAAIASDSFTFNNSASQGKKFVRDMSKLLLRAYNAEAENCVKAVKAGNLATAQKRLSTAKDQIERLGKMIDLRIDHSFHRLRLQELEIASRHLQAVKREKEEERAKREELREQRKAEQELQREKERLEKERSHYENALASLTERGDVEGAQRLREKLDDVERAINDVDYRTANIRAGYVYVISNVGAFGADVVKIGLTRRLNPMDRVVELGDASVPFRFDVHALFFAEDAVGIEAMLHNEFAEQRINKVNQRREFFRATPTEVLKALREHNVEVLEFTLEPAAEEFRTSAEISTQLTS